MHTVFWGPPVLPSIFRSLYIYDSLFLESSQSFPKGVRYHLLCKLLCMLEISITLTYCSFNKSFFLYTLDIQNAGLMYEVFILLWVCKKVYLTIRRNLRNVTVISSYNQIERTEGTHSKLHLFNISNNWLMYVLEAGICRKQLHSL